MTYLPDESKVVYKSKNGKNETAFDALEWLAAMCSHVPNKGEQMVRYYGFYSNVSRGKRKKHNQEGLIPSILEPEASSKEFRKNWARLIQKIEACPGLDPGKWILFYVPSSRAHEDHRFHRGPRGRQEDPQALGALGEENKAAT